MSEEELTRTRAALKDTFGMTGLESDLGIELEELKEGMIRLSLATEARHGNVYGIVHGGVMAALADIAMASACATLHKRIVTLDMNISYIKNAPVGSVLTAVGRVVHSGRTIVRTTGKILCGETVLARIQASYFVTGEGLKKGARPAG